MPNTHKRGTKAIDHVWLTANLLQAVEQAGYAPFDKIIENTDHRGIFFDIDLGIILDHDVVNIQPAQFRRLKATIPKRVQKYNDLVSKGWTDQNIESRLDSLINMILNDGMTSTHEATLNNIDHNITEILRHAEKNVVESTAIVIVNGVFYLEIYYRMYTKREMKKTKQAAVSPESLIMMEHNDSKKLSTNIMKKSRLTTQ